MLSACSGLVGDSSDQRFPSRFQVPCVLLGVYARLWPTSTTASIAGSPASSSPCWGAPGPAGRCFHVPSAKVHVSESSRLGPPEAVHGCGVDGAGQDGRVEVSACPPNSSSPRPDGSAASSAADLPGGAAVATGCHRSPVHRQVRSDGPIRRPARCWPPKAITLPLPGSWAMPAPSNCCAVGAGALAGTPLPQPTAARNTVTADITRRPRFAMP